jgi:hypothetical protein
VRGSEGWTEVDLPEPVTPRAKRRLLQVLRAEYR